MNVFLTLFKKHKFLTFINLIILIVFFLIVLILVVNIHQSSIEIKATQKFKDRNLYRISDNLFGEKEVEFFSKESSNDILSNLVNELANNSEYIYYNAIWQPIGVADFRGDSIFDAYYERGIDKKPYNINNKSYKTVKSMQLNNNVFDINNIQLDNGRYFKKEEFIFEELNKKIPILLGAEYKGIYKLGDILDIDYYQKMYKGTVIGFIAPSQKIMTTNMPEIILDRYIILPAMIFKEPPSNFQKTNKESPIFVRALNLSMLNGTLITDLNPLQIRSLLDDIGTRAGFKDFSVIGANSLAIDSIIGMTEANRNILYVISSLLFVFTTIILFITLSLKIKKNIETFKVLLISGASYNYIIKMVCNELLFTSLIGSIIPIIPLFMIIHNPILFLTNYLLIILIINILLYIIVYKFTNSTINRLDIVQQLKG